MRGFDRPGARLGFTARPHLAAQDGSLVRRAGLEFHRVPPARLPGKRNRFREVGGDLGRPAPDLELLRSAHEIERVPLGHEPHVGHAGLLEGGSGAERLREGIGVGAGRRRCAGGRRSGFLDAGLLRAEVGPNDVAVQCDRPDPALAASAFGDRRNFDEAFRPVDLTDHVAIPHADPRERWLALHDARLGIGRERSLVEVERPWERRHRTDAGLALQCADLCRHDRSGMLARGGRVGAVACDRAGGGRERGGRFLHEPARCVEEANFQGQRLTGGDLGLGRHDLHPGGCARRGLGGVGDLLRHRRADGCGGGCRCGFLAEAIQPRVRREIEESPGGDRRGRYFIRLVEPHPVYELQPVLRRLEHVPAARRTHVEFAVGHEWAAADDRAEQFLRAADCRARLPVERIHLRTVIDEIHTVAEHDRHRPAVHHALLLPDHVRGRDVARAGRLECRGRSHRCVVEVFLRLRDDHRVAGDERRGVDATARELEVPDGLARPRLEVPHAAVARAEDERGGAAEVGERRRAVGRVFGELLRAVHPADLAGRLVHPQEAMGGPGGVAPARHDGAGDHEILEHHRNVRPAAVGGEKAEFLMERPLPFRRSRGGVDGREHAAHAVGEDGAAGRIGHHGRPADPLGRHVRKIDVEDVFPELFARGGVEAEHLLRLFRRPRLVPHEREEPPAHDHGGGNAACLVALPEHVGALPGIERSDQRRAGVVPILLRAAPVGPIGRRGE